MALPFTNKSDLDADLQVFYNKTLVDNLNPLLFYVNHCDKQFGDVPMNAGQVIEFMRYNKLAPQTTPLSQTADGAGKTLSRSKVRATVQEYGDHTVIPKYTSKTEIDSDIESNIKNIFAVQEAESYDLITREVMISTSQPRYSNGKTAGTLLSTDLANVEDIRKISAKMRNDNVMKFEGDVFHGIFSAFQAYDIRADTTAGGFIDINKYHDAEKLRKAVDSKGLFGVIESVALYETSQTKNEVINGANAYHGLIMGKQAYAVPEIDAAKTGVMVKAPEVSTVDVHGRFTVVSWYGMFVPTALDQSAAGSLNIRSWDYMTSATASI